MNITTLLTLLFVSVQIKVDFHVSGVSVINLCGCRIRTVHASTHWLLSSSNSATRAHSPAESIGLATATTALTHHFVEFSECNVPLRCSGACKAPLLQPCNALCQEAHLVNLQPLQISAEFDKQMHMAAARFDLRT